MLRDLLTQTLVIMRPNVVFDGLSEEETDETTMSKLPGRIRRLTAREQYVSQGQQEVTTHRAYINGSLDDHPELVDENIIFCAGLRYKIQDVNQARTLDDHHIELDLIRVQGVT